jgi:hypothetical protein
LTFSVVVLNKYAATVDPVTGRIYGIYELALMRAGAVMVGVIVGMFVSWYVWPFKVILLIQSLPIIIYIKLVDNFTF